METHPCRIRRGGHMVAFTLAKQHGQVHPPVLKCGRAERRHVRLVNQTAAGTTDQSPSHRTSRVRFHIIGNV